MAEATKSVLLVDYDSIHRSLSAGEPEASDRFASQLASWVGAIEAGSLVSTKPGAGGRRRVLIRRCYADPALLGSDRTAFLAHGFQVIDCPPAEGRKHNAAAIHIVLDSIEALDHPAEYEEFILFCADSDLSPLLIQLRAHNRQTAIYTTAATTDSYKAIADAAIEESRFVAALLSDDEELEENDEPEKEARPPPTRTEIETVARKVSSATNVPLFAPRTFAELFRRLVEEIGENGYHFQTTAENVATRMAEAGRNVSRRQVVFVVKGLALKGHMFSTEDMPERLADVFREQVLYLAENAGLTLDEDERRILSSWIVGSVAAAPEGPQESGVQKTASSAASDKKVDSPKGDDGQSSRSPKRKPLRSPGTARSSDTDAKSAEPDESQAPAAANSSDGLKATAPRQQAAVTTKLAPKPTTSGLQKPSSDTPASASRGKIAASSGSSAIASDSAVRSRPTTTSRPNSSSRQSDSDADDNDPVESSILAAIAQAVDVLVEDSSNEPDELVESADEIDDDVEDNDQDEAATAEAEPQEKDDESPESDDIGDEIQRIIASYSRKRGKDAE